MSAEVYGKPDASAIVTEASFGAANILVALGRREDAAWTMGQNAGKYGAELLLAAFSELDIALPLDERATEICEAIEVIADCTANPKHLNFYKEAKEAGLRLGDFNG